MNQQNELGNTVRLRGFVNHLKQSQYGKMFSMTLESGKTREGDYRKEYIPVRINNETAQNCFFDQGSKVWVSGRLRAEKYDYKGETKTSTFVQAFDIQQIEAPKQQAPQAQYQQQAPQQQQQYQQQQAPQAQPGYQQYQQAQPQAPVYQQQRQAQAPVYQQQPSDPAYQQQQPQAPYVAFNRQGPSKQAEAMASVPGGYQPQPPQAPDLDQIPF